MANEGNTEAKIISSQPAADQSESRDQDVLQDEELDEVNGGNMMTTVLTNLVNMRHEMLKNIVQNLRG